MSKVKDHDARLGDIRIKRAHEPPSPDDGFRVLVDRIWPRGLSKAELALDARTPEIAPSTELRRWFGHDPQKWDEFQARYWRELDANRAGVEALLELCRKPVVTLVFAAHDAEHSNARALQAYLQRARSP